MYHWCGQGTKCCFPAALVVNESAILFITCLCSCFRESSLCKNWSKDSHAFWYLLFLSQSNLVSRYKSKIGKVRKIVAGSPGRPRPVSAGAARPTAAARKSAQENRNRKGMRNGGLYGKTSCSISLQGTTGRKIMCAFRINWWFQKGHQESHGGRSLGRSSEKIWLRNFHWE